MKRFCALILFFPLFLFSAESVPLVQAISDTVKDVQSSTLELNRVRNDIENQRLPMSEKLSDLQDRVAQLRGEVRQIRDAKNLRDDRRQTLKNELRQLREENEFVNTVLQEYRRSYETRLGVAEVSLLEAQALDDAQAFLAALPEWFERRARGYQFSGSVLDKMGREQLGDFFVLGPMSYFLNEEMGGLVVTRPNSSLAGLYTFDKPQQIDALRNLFKGEAAMIPVDVSGGDAIKRMEAKTSWLEHLQKGGVVVIPLLVIGFLALLMALRKAYDLHKMVVHLDADSRSLLRGLSDENLPERLKKVQGLPQPISSLVSAGIQHRNASREHLEEILHEHVLAVLPRLENSLGTLAVFGGVAPLLGLLGTVTGMIHTFELVTIFGSGNAKTLSGGISEALVTTEVGLLIAIPILLVHSFLARKAKNLLGEFEQTAVSLVNQLKSSATLDA